MQGLDTISDSNYVYKMKLQLAVLLAFGLASVALAAPRVDTNLYRSLVLKRSANVIVSFHGSRTYELRNKFRTISKTLASRGQRLNTLYANLKNHADETQANVINFLRAQKSSVSHSQLWISNQIIIRNADLNTVQKLLAFPEVSYIRESRQIPMIKPVEVINHPEGYVPQEGEQWGVVELAAPDVWAQGNRGENVTVGIIDSGVRPTHVALKNRIRSEYGWFFPGRMTVTPGDSMGHGTHVAGTIAGEVNGIGVAPGANIAVCRACGILSCAEDDLLECGQWAACPTKTDGTDADCTKAPQLVSNSWGGGNEDPFYDEVIDTWLAAGIIPVFALGNSGPMCETANSPGDSANVIGVGSINAQRQTSSFSSLGPTQLTGRVKPDIAAPGTNIVSSSYYGENTYATMSGTSMATPHVSGLIALILSAQPGLELDEVRALLAATALPHKSQSKTCGGIADSIYPNNHVGHGVVNAPSAVAGAQKYFVPRA